jgi:hypothetical protein
MAVNRPMPFPSLGLRLLAYLHVCNSAPCFRLLSGCRTQVEFLAMLMQERIW